MDNGFLAAQHPTKIGRIPFFVQCRTAKGIFSSRQTFFRPMCACERFETLRYATPPNSTTSDVSDHMSPIFFESFDISSSDISKIRHN